MAVLFLILPLAILLAGTAAFGFLRATRSGQFDDVDTPPWRVIFDDDEGGKAERRRRE